VKKNLVLLGMMAVGKTTIARIVAKKLNLKFIDIDKNIIKNNSMTIVEIFKKKGEVFFRKEEEVEVLKSLQEDSSIIALGGGAFINKVIREKILKSAISIWLDINIETINKRIKKNNKRPLLNKVNNLTELRDLYNKRKNIYALDNNKIKCDKLDKTNILKKILKIYEN